MKFRTDPYYTTAFGAVIDQEIADALRAGMSLEHVYTELAARARAVAELIVDKHTHHNCIEVPR